MRSIARWLLRPLLPSEHPVPLLSGQDLAALLDRVIFDLCKLPTIAVGSPAPGPVRMDLEYSVQLPGAHACRLTLRADAELAADLAQAATGDPGARADGANALRELCRLLAGQLGAVELAPTNISPPSHLPAVSTPQQWPPRIPDCECVVLVAYRPLEARLWAERQAKGASQ